MLLLGWLVAALVAVVVALSLALIAQRDLFALRLRKLARLEKREERLYDLAERWLDGAAEHREQHPVEHDGEDYAGGLIDAACDLEMALDDDEAA